LNTIIENYILEHLEEHDGKLFWKNLKNRTDFNRKEAGWMNNTGYKRVKVLGKSLLCHRIIYFIHTGEWPKEIDHKDRNPLNNKIENLRACSRSQNRTNSKKPNNASRFGRNIKMQRSGNYSVVLKINNEDLHIGTFEDLELAQLVASEAREKYYGEWAYDY